ncbi:hypothetical protein [Shimia sp.]|uniref:hypothetical protein n=1 Tax=Shimia sp. TaxID=1954381 RepID=UPI003B8BC986
MNFRHLIRMSRLARNPPSEKRVKLVFGVIIACLVLALIERFIGWPDALTADRIPRIGKF